MIKRFAIALAISLFVLMCVSVPGCGSAQQLPADTVSVPEAAVSMDLSAIEPSVDPCQNFYAYACGNWQRKHPIPADRTQYGRLEELSDRNRYTLYRLLEKAADSPHTPLQAKYGNFFAACMNQPRADSLGTKPIEPMLHQVARLMQKKQLAALLGTVAVPARPQGPGTDGSGLMYSFSSDQDQTDSTKVVPELRQGGLSLLDPDFYLRSDPRSVELRARFQAHVAKMFTLLGDTPEQATLEAKAVIAIETALAKGSMARVDLRNPEKRHHTMSLQELQKLTPDFDWAAYLAVLHRSVTTLNVATPDFFASMNTMINEASLQDLRSYLRWRILDASADSLSQPFINENFAFNGGFLGGQKQQQPLWRRCTQATDLTMGEAVGEDWVAANFSPAAKQNIQVLVADLQRALGQDIQNLDWMGDTTKAEAQRKLAALRTKIGYPDRWRDYSALKVSRDDRYGNVRRSAVFERDRQLDKVGRPVNEKEWGMSPPTVNAYYNPSQNDINFPAGILQPPFYDFKIDPAVNFGAIGDVIGHELTHGFDDQGSKYDAQGNVKSWWTAEDRKKFEERTDCEAREFDGFEPTPGIHLNGHLTLGENTADNGGLRIAYAAFHGELQKTPDAESKKIDGYTQDQRFFIAHAQVWCENIRPEAELVLAKTSTHAPGRFRVNGEVQNLEMFGKAWACKKGDPMYPVNSCRIW